MFRELLYNQAGIPGSSIVYAFMNFNSQIS